MEEGNITVLVDAKEEYTKQLISIFKPCIYQGIKSIYADAKDICHQDNTPDNVLMVFQDLLSRIPKWSQDIINKEFERIMNASKCDYIEDLLKVVYVSHIKILTIVHSSQKNKKISMKVPSGSHFMHLCYIECAREFWKDPYLFSDRVSKFEHQKNMRDSETMIADCINETIRKQLPVRHILKEFLNEPDEDIEEEEDIKEPVNKKYLKKLESVVKKELKTSNKGSDIDIDLIRKVIREEMDARPTIANSNTIKKELINTVVEKIVEQVQEEETADPIKPINLLNTLETFVTSTSDEIHKNQESNNTENLTNSTDEKEIPKEIPKEVKEGNVDNIAITNDIKTEKTEKTEKTIEVDITAVKINETSEVVVDSNKQMNKSGGFEELLDDDIAINNLDDDIAIDSNELVIAVSEQVVPAEIPVAENPVVVNEKDVKNENKNKILINNIDEINLNLDELDNELENELDLDDLKTVDFKKSNNDVNNQVNNEVNKVTNTKYIFFKDAM